MPGERREEVASEMRDTIAALTAAHPELDVSLSEGLVRQPMSTDPGTAVAAAVRAALSAFPERSLEPTGMGFWTDAGLLDEQGIESVVIGPSAVVSTRPSSGSMSRRSSTSPASSRTPRAASAASPAAISPVERQARRR